MPQGLRQELQHHPGPRRARARLQGPAALQARGQGGRHARRCHGEAAGQRQGTARRARPARARARRHLGRPQQGRPQAASPAGGRAGSSPPLLPRHLHQRLLEQLPPGQECRGAPPRPAALLSLCGRAPLARHQPGHHGLLAQRHRSPSLCGVPPGAGPGAGREPEPEPPPPARGPLRRSRGVGAAGPPAGARRAPGRQAAHRRLRGGAGRLARGGRWRRRCCCGWWRCCCGWWRCCCC